MISIPLYTGVPSSTSSKIQNDDPNLAITTFFTKSIKNSTNKIRNTKSKGKRPKANASSHNVCHYGYPFFLSPNEDDEMLEIPNPTPTVHRTQNWFVDFFPLHRPLTGGIHSRMSWRGPWMPLDPGILPNYDGTVVQRPTFPLRIRKNIRKTTLSTFVPMFGPSLLSIYRKL